MRELGHIQRKRGLEARHVDHRQPQRHTKIKLGGLGDARLAINYHGNIKTGAAHVTSDDFIKTRFFG